MQTVIDMENPETNKAADRLIGGLKEHFKRVHGKTLSAKEVVKEATAVIKGRVK